MFKITATEKKMVQRQRGRGNSFIQSTQDASEVIGMLEEASLAIDESYQEVEDEVGDYVKKNSDKKPLAQFRRFEKAYALFEEELERLIRAIKR